MKRKIHSLGMGMVFWLLLLSSRGHAETVVVQIVKSTFVPAVVEVRKGDSVRWVNTEPLPHSVTSGKAPFPDDKFNAPFLTTRFEVTMDQEGVFDYFCAIHNVTMRGVIIVEDEQ